MTIHYALKHLLLAWFAAFFFVVNCRCPGVILGDGDQWAVINDVVGFSFSSPSSSAA